MLASQASAATATLLLKSQSAANTSAATSAWTAVPTSSEGMVLVIINIGTITGTIDFTFNTATDGAGTGSAALTNLATAIPQITTSNDDAVYVARFPASVMKGYINVVGTIVTGPALLSYTMITRNKTV
jgi:hypothetical protein